MKLKTTRSTLNVDLSTTFIDWRWRRKKKLSTMLSRWVHVMLASSPYKYDIGYARLYRRTYKGEREIHINLRTHSTYSCNNIAPASRVQNHRRLRCRPTVLYALFSVATPIMMAWRLTGNTPKCKKPSMNRYPRDQMRRIRNLCWIEKKRSNLRRAVFSPTRIENFLLHRY